MNPRILLLAQVLQYRYFQLNPGSEEEKETDLSEIQYANSFIDILYIIFMTCHVVKVIRNRIP